MIGLGDNRYGKSRVRVVRVKRSKGVHELREWNVQILLRGDFESCFTEADNSKILPTDTMKNTVYSLARRSSAQSIEAFAKELVDFLLSRNPQLSHAQAHVSEKVWSRALVNGKAHPTTFIQSTVERPVTTVERAHGAGFSVISGFENLVIMKTADSAFEGYIEDDLTTLGPSTDRLLGTAVQASWKYAHPDLNFEELRSKIREILVAAFADHDSRSVQHTLYVMGEAALASTREVQEIELAMPNIHCLLVDLTPFGQDNPNEIFVPTEEPYGYIEARICRQG
jgi:urate oxidase